MDAFDIAAAVVACAVLLAMALALFMANHYGRRYRSR